MRSMATCSSLTINPTHVSWMNELPLEGASPKRPLRSMWTRRWTQQQRRVVFFPHDTHWSPTGRMVVAETLIDTIAPGLWEPEAVIERELRELAVLGRFLGGTEGVVSGPSVSRPTIDVITMNQQTTADGLIQSQWTQATGASVISGRTLLIGDSQMAYLIPEIESYFEDLEFYLWDLLSATSKLPSAEGVDRVIVQSVETAAGRRFSHPQLERVFGELVKSDAD
jgi:hypothetical protein